MTEGRVLLTGGSGLIGGAVLSSLKRQGWTVTSSDIRDSAAASQLADRTIVGDVRDFTARDLEGYDAVIHLAAMLEPAKSLGGSGAADEPQAVFDRAERMVSVNVLGTQSLFAAAVAAGVPAVVYASTVGVYGPRRLYALAEGEEVPSYGPFAPFALYSHTKLMNEGIAAFYAREFPTRFIGLRPTFAYGMGRLTGVAGMVAQWIVDAAAGRRAVLEPPFGLDGHHQTFYVKDMADAFVDAARVAIDGSGYPDGVRALVLNTPTREYLSVAEMLQVVRDVTGNPDVHVVEEQSRLTSPRIDSAEALRILGTEQRFPFPAAVADIADEARRLGLA